MIPDITEPLGAPYVAPRELPEFVSRLPYLRKPRETAPFPRGTAVASSSPQRGGLMRRALLFTIGLTLLAGPAAADSEPKSALLAKQPVAAMAARQLDAIVAADPDDPVVPAA